MVNSPKKWIETTFTESVSTGSLPWLTENSFADRTYQMFIWLINEGYNNDTHRLSVERFPKHFLHPRKLQNSL